MYICTYVCICLQGAKKQGSVCVCVCVCVCLCIYVLLINVHIYYVCVYAIFHFLFDRTHLRSLLHALSACGLRYHVFGGIFGEQNFFL